MRLNLDDTKQPLTASEAAAAAGITVSRLALWHHRGHFRSEEDVAEDRGPGDPRLYTPTDVLRMRALSTCTNAGISIEDGQKALEVLDKMTDPEGFVLLVDRGEGFEAQAARRGDLVRIMTPDPRKLTPPAVFSISVEFLLANTAYRLREVIHERATGRSVPGADYLAAAGAIEAQPGVTV